MATVPCPAITSGSSNGWMKVSPCACSMLQLRGHGRPNSFRRAARPRRPSASTASTLSLGVVTGITITARTPSRLGAERDALGVVARRGADDTALQRVRRQLDHLVERTAQLEAEDGLRVLAFQQNVVVRVDARGSSPAPAPSPPPRRRRGPSGSCAGIRTGDGLRAFRDSGATGAISRDARRARRGGIGRRVTQGACGGHRELQSQGWEGPPDDTAAASTHCAPRCVNAACRSASPKGPRQEKRPGASQLSGLNPPIFRRWRRQLAGAFGRHCCRGRKSRSGTSGAALTMNSV